MLSHWRHWSPFPFVHIQNYLPDYLWTLFELFCQLDIDFFKSAEIILFLLLTEYLDIKILIMKNATKEAGKSTTLQLPSSMMTDFLRLICDQSALTYADLVNFFHRFKDSGNHHSLSFYKILTCLFGL